MLVSEEEAKMKWCPQLEDQRDHCIASRCMAWRWESEGSYQARSSQWQNEDRVGRCPAAGYCGLAGKPE